ncbi:MAG: hypothetical protein LBG48_04015 [Rickettsiales bacterium]|nr:hypothetical protein [Rickettsiales bacterium]
MKTKTLFFILLSIIIPDCGVSSLRFDCISFVSPKRTNTAMTERWSRGYLHLIIVVSSFSLASIC